MTQTATNDERVNDLMFIIEVTTATTERTTMLTDDDDDASAVLAVGVLVLTGTEVGATGATYLTHAVKEVSLTRHSLYHN